MPLGAMMITTTTTAVLLGAVVAAVAGAALAPAVLPPAHAAAGEPGTLAFRFGSLGVDDGEFSGPYAASVSASGNFIVTDGGGRNQVFYPNGTFAFKLDASGRARFIPSGDIVVVERDGVQVFYPNGTFAFRHEQVILPNHRGIDYRPDGTMGYTARRHCKCVPPQWHVGLWGDVAWAGRVGVFE